MKEEETINESRNRDDRAGLICLVCDLPPSQVHSNPRTAAREAKAAATKAKREAKGKASAKDL